MDKPILCLDFDGVLHSYTSGRQGETIIPDPPVEGAQEFCEAAVEYFTVMVYSSRSKTVEGRLAMASWLEEHGFPTELHFAVEKPPAFVTLDDRAITFTGHWPTIDELLAFQPWHQRAAERDPFEQELLSNVFHHLREIALYLQGAGQDALANNAVNACITFDCMEGEIEMRRQQVERLSQAESEMETLRNQLTACTVAICGGPEDQIGPDHPYYTAAYQDVRTLHDREAQLQIDVEQLRRWATRLEGDLDKTQQVLDLLPGPAAPTEVEQRLHLAASLAATYILESSKFSAQVDDQRREMERVQGLLQKLAAANDANCSGCQITRDQCRAVNCMGARVRDVIQLAVPEQARSSR